MHFDFVIHSHIPSFSKDKVEIFVLNTGKSHKSHSFVCKIFLADFGKQKEFIMLWTGAYAEGCIPSCQKNLENLKNKSKKTNPNDHNVVYKWVKMDEFLSE